MRRWLAFYAVAVTSIVVLAFSIPLAVLIRDLAADRAINAAEREAQTIARFAATVDPGGAVALLTSTLEGSERTTLLLDDGTVLGAPVPPGVDLSPATSSGQAYRQRVEEGQVVVVPVFRAGTTPWVVAVFVPSAALTENVASAWLVLALLGIALMALASLVADRLGRAVVNPIMDLVDATERLGQGDLGARVDPSGPHELALVGSTFNDLTGRVRSLMNREREAAADLSHRLRTPLTALRLDVEAAAKAIDATRLQRDVEELERVVGHVISEARRGVREDGEATADLATVVAERAEFWGHLADDQNRNRSLEIESGVFRVAADPTELDAMLDAILGNIFSHTEPGIGYRITLRRSSGGMAELTIVDDGPGIEDAALLERGASGGKSTGLGADIIRATAEAAGGSADWSPVLPGGTKVRVVLPLSRVSR